MFGLTFLVGYLNDKYGPRILISIGSVVMLFALFMTSLCHAYWQLFLAQGLLLGIGLSFLVLPAFATVPHYFTKHRALAMGITVSGSSMGGVIWPIALKNLLYEIGFGWGVRVAAFIMLPLLLVATLSIRLPVKEVCAAETKPKPDLTIIRHPVLILLAIGTFFIYLGIFSPFFYITTWTVSLGFDASLAFYTISIINAASLFGRILPGMAADKIGAYNMMILSALFSGVVCCCWTKATSIGGIVILSLSYGFASGAVIALQGACSAQIVKPAQYGVAMGSVLSILSIAGLTGSPISGYILNAWGFLGLSLFSGLAMLIRMLAMILAKLMLGRKLLAKA